MKAIYKQKISYKNGGYSKQIFSPPRAVTS